MYPCLNGYIIVWYRYCLHLGLQTFEQQAGARLVIKQHLLGWRRWVSSIGATDQETKMSRCPSLVPVQVYDRAVVGGMHFTSRSHSSRLRANKSVVVMQDEAEHPAIPPQQWEKGAELSRVGEVRKFFEWQPPWVTYKPVEELEPPLQVADVRWSEWQGKNTALMDAPPVKQCLGSYHHPGGDLVLLREFLPIRVALVPHLQQPNWLHLVCEQAKLIFEVPFSSASSLGQCCSVACPDSYNDLHVLCMLAKGDKFQCICCGRSSVSMHVHHYIMFRVLRACAVLLDLAEHLIWQGE